MQEKPTYNSYRHIYPKDRHKSFVRVLFGLGVAFLIILFLPWQQNVRSTGKIIALRPNERPQYLQTAISGRIKEWRVYEGQHVNKGDTLVVLTEVKEKYLDPQLVERIGEQQNAKQQGIEALTDKLSAIDKQIAALENNKILALQKARNKIKQARLKVKIDSADLQAAQLDVKIALQQLQRNEALYKEGLKSLAEVETRRLKWQESLSKESNAMDKLLISNNEVKVSALQLADEQNAYNEKIAKALSDRQSTESYIAENRGTVAKLQNEQQDAENRQAFRVIIAPQNGFISRVLRAGIGEIIKENETVITLVPHDPELAAELFVDPTHISLVRNNNNVRLRFDGWPVLQVSGWPEAALGTYGGKVLMIDFVADEYGKYRVLITPDKNDEAWPDALRIGTSANGWVLMNEVPIWFELWRQINGFPLSPTEDKPAKTGKAK
ncbi:MAG: HlyD family secretion protein [Bacteroidia bacterium]